MRWLAVALVLACGACSSGGSDAGDDPSTSVAPTSAASGPAPEGTTVPTGHGPVGLAVDPAGSLWVASSGASQVNRVRAGRSDLVVGDLEVPLRLLAARGSVWATAFGSGDLVQIAADGKIRGRVAVGRGAEGVAAGFGSIWVVAQDVGRLVRVDPVRLTVLAQVDIGVGARLVASGLGSVWVSQFQDGRVLRVNPRTKAVTRSEQVCQGPQGLLARAGGVWVTCTEDDVLLRLDATTLKVTARVPMPEAPDGIAAGPGDTVYVVSQAGPTLVTVDAAQAVVTAKQVLGAQPQLYDQANLDIVVSADGVWVSSFAENLVRRVTVPGP